MPNPLVEAVIIANTEAIPVAFAEAGGVERTAAISKSTGSGTVTAGKKSVSFFVSGAAAATVAGQTIPEGTTVGFNAQGADTLGAISYNATGSELTIATLA